jgi:hypothetical protein
VTFDVKTYMKVCGHSEHYLLNTDMRKKYFVQNFLREDRIFLIIATVFRVIKEMSVHV